MNKIHLVRSYDFIQDKPIKYRIFPKWFDPYKHNCFIECFARLFCYKSNEKPIDQSIWYEKI